MVLRCVPLLSIACDNASEYMTCMTSCDGRLHHNQTLYQFETNALVEGSLASFLIIDLAKYTNRPRKNGFWTLALQTKRHRQHVASLNSYTLE
jgi:hypothetical protein